MAWNPEDLTGCPAWGLPRACWTSQVTLSRWGLFLGLGVSTYGEEAW